MVQLAWMSPKLKISHHKHTGRLLAHEFTSYLPLAFIVLLVGVALVIFTMYDASASPGPEAGSVGITGQMPGPPPKTGATILSPSDGQHLKTSPVTVSGSCETDTLVELYKNNIFAGSGQCNNNKFSIQIDLLFGENTLTAQVYDALNQAGPASNSVTVFYDFSLPPTDPLAALNLGGAQLLLNTNAVYRGTFPGQPLNVPVTIIGGSPPYAVNVLWGDTSNKIIPRSDNLTFNATHVYKKAGTFGITLQASDSQQRSAFLTVAAIVNGQPSPIPGSSSAAKAAAKGLLVLWPMYAIAATTLASFWIGEHREKKILNKVAAAQQNPFEHNSPPQEKPLAK